VRLAGSLAPAVREYRGLTCVILCGTLSSATVPHRSSGQGVSRLWSPIAMRKRTIARQLNTAAINSPAFASGTRKPLIVARSTPAMRSSPEGKSTL
jgi:hypothetical protein